MTVPRVGNNEVQCPHCGVAAESGPRCSHCGMLLKKRAGRKRVRIAVLLFTVLLLCILQFCAAQREPSLISCGDINPLMNFQVVRVEGTLETPARKLANGTMLYTVNDGTGMLAVFSSEMPAGSFPKVGSRVAAVGNLSVGVGNQIRMQARSVELLEAPPIENYISEFHLSEITTDLLDVQMTVFGTVSRVWKPEPGSRAPHRIILEDPSGTLEVVHWLKDPPEVAEGDALQINGRVTQYNGKLQLKVWKADAIRPVVEDAGPSQWVSIGDITPEMEGRWVIAEGMLGEPRSIPGGVIYPFADKTGTILALFWDKRISGEERDALDEGVRIRLEGEVVLYNGVLELVPRDVGGFRPLD
ncbi:hypothetical protein P4B35_13215 [Pontiellaceae bacterium B12227]|nr:hypothetical protein [Pontiellaceae bacterium B12227]